MKVQDIPSLAAGAVAGRPGRPATALAYDSADVRVVIFRIDPGQEVPMHTSTSTVLLMIVSGTGTVMGADGDHPVQTGDIVAYDTEEPHGMRAGGQPLVIAAIIAPRPGLHPTVS
jgi:quercetin dioxygenase-like cupin family protein